MRSLMAAVACILGAVMIVVVEWCQALGRFVERCRPGHVAPDPQDLVCHYLEAVEAAAVTPELDQRLQGIQITAEAIFRGNEVTGDMVAGLSANTMAWIEALDAGMLLMVARAEPCDLKEHLIGRKTIKGLLAADPESIATYVRAIQAETALERQPTARKPRRREQLLPMFGPIC